MLFGLIPPKQKGQTADPNSGHSFVQTEMYGFQTFYNTYPGHGLGFIRSAIGYGNSGILGYSARSEKQGLAIERGGRPIGVPPTKQKWE